MSSDLFPIRKISVLSSRCEMMAQTRPFGVCPRNAFFVVELIMESFSSEMHSFRSHVLIFKIQEQKQYPTPTLHYLNF
jgi:hypothetical protein